MGSGNQSVKTPTDWNATRGACVKTPTAWKAVDQIYIKTPTGWNNASGQEATQNPYPYICLLYTSPSPRDLSTSRMPSSA